MKFNTIEEASVELFKYRNWNNVISESNGKQIAGTFVGINDLIMSKNIWSGIRGVLPSHPFTNSDLDNIEFWVAFTDDEILNVKEVLEDDYMQYLLTPNSLRQTIYIGETWHIPLRIPLGLHVRLIIKEDTEFDYKITVTNKPDKAIEKTEISRGENGRFNIFYEEIKAIAPHHTDKPNISFKLSQRGDKLKEIEVLFVDIIVPSIH